MAQLEGTSEIAGLQLPPLKIVCPFQPYSVFENFISTNIISLRLLYWIVECLLTETKRIQLQTISLAICERNFSSMRQVKNRVAAIIEGAYALLFELQSNLSLSSVEKDFIFILRALYSKTLSKCRI